MEELWEAWMFQPKLGNMQRPQAATKLEVVELMSLCVRQVLGGQVEELLEAWTFQRKFGNVQRPAGAADDTEQPPAFQSFIPGRRHNQAGHR